ncbi:hypothetical protein SAMN04487820_108127 [Actinopolyspora mzabensis]|uniref:Uncharacterized protein n=1 Tax=Actinopolyspora mzabensis TaxID=995066 RepID=A0A1G9C5G1_ACTMZ|nr:hypothetical protein [Actinopolyspora mzabensis]SDK46923.1 hypothetical protein SAMN04487820_108127 [Actinopolyspora mzabensis]
MTGPEHFKTAQRLLAEAPEQHDQDKERTYVAYAQAHATLAHAAATAQAGGPIFNEDGEFVIGGMTEPQEAAWKTVLDPEGTATE